MAVKRLGFENATSERPPRFAIAMGVRFRPLDEINWREGEIEDISRSGIRFHTAQPVDLNTRIEFMFDLPVEMGGEAGAHVVCVGEITRVIPPSAPDQWPVLAASIGDYHFVRGAADDAE